MGGRIDRLELRIEATAVHLHLEPFGVRVALEHQESCVTLAVLNEALLLQHKLRRCLTPELRSDYAPGFRDTFLRYKCAPPRIAFQDFDPEAKYELLDFAKSYPSIVRDAKEFAKFSRFDRFQPYDGHVPKRNNVYVWKKRPSCDQLGTTFQVQFKDERGLKYGRYLFEWLDHLDIECYAEPFKVVKNPFKDALKAIFNSDLPSTLKKRASNLVIGEFGKWRTHFKTSRLSTTKEVVTHLL